MTTRPERTTTYDADALGWFGGPAEGFGGRFMPEALVAALDELTVAAPDDPAAFASAVSALLRDPARRAALGAAGRRLVEERYGWRQVAREFQQRCEEARENHHHAR